MKKLNYKWKQLTYNNKRLNQYDLKLNGYRLGGIYEMNDMNFFKSFTCLVGVKKDGIHKNLELAKKDLEKFWNNFFKKNLT